MNNIISIMGLLVVSLISSGTLAQVRYTVQGSVLDSLTRTPISKAKVDILDADTRKVIQTEYTNGEGQYVMRITEARKLFLAEASADAYRSSFPVRFTLNNPQEVKILEPIFLQRIDGSGLLNAGKIDTVPARQFVENKFEVLNIMPTKGAESLFYALNPQLRGMEMIPANYPVRQPEFPTFKVSRKPFNKKFRKDKKKGEPFISYYDQSIRLHDTYSAENKGRELDGQFQIHRIGKGGYSSQTDIDNPEICNTVLTHWDVNANSIAQVMSKARTKRFVFAMWKLGENQEVIDHGPEVENRYKVIYYTERTTNTPNQSSNATYGYAPMVSAKYYIKVYDQRGDPDQPVTVSDTEIDPRIYFERNDLISLFGKVWIRIPIQIFD